MPNQEEAQKALDGLNGHDLEQQRIRVNEARPPEARGPRMGGNNSSYGGGGNRFRNDRGGGSSDRNERGGSRFGSGSGSSSTGGFGYSRPKW